MCVIDCFVNTAFLEADLGRNGRLDPNRTAPDRRTQNCIWQTAHREEMRVVSRGRAATPRLFALVSYTLLDGNVFGRGTTFHGFGERARTRSTVKVCGRETVAFAVWPLTEQETRLQESREDRRKRSLRWWRFNECDVTRYPDRRRCSFFDTDQCDRRLAQWNLHRTILLSDENMDQRKFLEWSNLSFFFSSSFLA